MEKEMVCIGLDQRTMTHLLDVRHQEWRHIRFDEQFLNLRNQLFQNHINLVLQT